MRFVDVSGRKSWCLLERTSDRRSGYISIGTSTEIVIFSEDMELHIRGSGESGPRRIRQNITSQLDDLGYDWIVLVPGAKIGHLRGESVHWLERKKIDSDLGYPIALKVGNFSLNARGEGSHSGGNVEPSTSQCHCCSDDLVSPENQSGAVAA